jgi:hypothetical protein
MTNLIVYISLSLFTNITHTRIDACDFEARYKKPCTFADCNGKGRWTNQIIEIYEMREGVFRLEDGAEKRVFLDKRFVRSGTLLNGAETYLRLAKGGVYETNITNSTAWGWLRVADPPLPKIQKGYGAEIPVYDGGKLIGIPGIMADPARSFE